MRGGDSKGGSGVCCGREEEGFGSTLGGERWCGGARGGLACTLAFLFHPELEVGAVPPAIGHDLLF